MSSTMTAIDLIMDHAEKIRNGQITVGGRKLGPGQVARFPEAASPGEYFAQGDVNTWMVGHVSEVDLAKVIPRGFEKLPAGQGAQLVPGTASGNTSGERHILTSTDSVTIYRAKDWNPESLVGPILVTSADTTIDHPEHGALTLPGGFVFALTYQREYAKELERERRARD